MTWPKFTKTRPKTKKRLSHISQISGSVLTSCSCTQWNQENCDVFTSHFVEKAQVDKTPKLVWNQLICMSFFVGFVPFRVALFEGISSLKNAWTFGQHFPMNCSKNGQSYEAFTYLWSIYMHIWPKYLHFSSLSKQKFCKSFKLSNCGKFWNYRWFWVESRINRKFPVIANFKRSTENFRLLREEKWRNLGQTDCKCFIIWVTKLGTIDCF